MLLIVLPLVASCATSGVAPRDICGPNDKAFRPSSAVIDLLTDEQVKDILSRNEDLERRGCAVANN